MVVVALSRLCSRRLLANPRTVSLARPMFSPSILSRMEMSKRLQNARGVWQTWCRCGWQNLPHQQCSISTLVLTLGCAGGCPYLVFLDMVTVLSGDRVLWSSPSSLVGRLAISTSSTSCKVSRSFSLIPALGLKTPRWRGSSSGTSGSRWAPTIWIFLFDLGENKAVKHKVLCGACRKVYSGVDVGGRRG